MRAIDITGQKFNFLTAMRYVESREQGGYMRTFWLYVCDCGKERTAAKSDVKCGKITSCGCQRRKPRDVANERRIKMAMEEQEAEELARQQGLKSDQLANRMAVPKSMRHLPGRIIQARHVDGHSVGVPLTSKGISSIMMESGGI